MNWCFYTLIGLGALAIIIGLLLSSSGSTGGLTSMNGQDLELFKKTKDRGTIKILQTLLYLDFLAMFILILVYHYS